MLSIIAYDIEGNRFELPTPVYMTLNRDENVPADDMALTFPFIESLPELDRITAKDGGETVFTGIIDEQMTISGGGGIFTKLVARSMAAVLLDNESKPVNYVNPSGSVIFSRHLAPCGIVACKGDDAVLKGPLNISKGCTHWQAFYSFCINALGKIPRIEADGTADFSGLERNGEILFSNNGGVSYSSIKENSRRCLVISRVFVKTSHKGDYDTVVQNGDGINRRIDRVRYLDASGAVPVTVADSMINNGRDSSYELVVVCPLRLLNIIGAKATVEDSCLGRRENLYVSALSYSLKPGVQATSVTLKKEYQSEKSG